VPQPVEAVILLFPLDGAIKAQRKAEDERLAKLEQPQLDKSILWIKQTIGNACGTMALLHALANTGVTIRPESALAQFIEECKDKTPIERARHLETTPLFASIHAELASGGQTQVPTNLDTDLHFTCFVQVPTSEKTRETADAGVGAGKEIQSSRGKMRLIELDGGRRGPIDRGECKDLLKDVAKIIKATYFTLSDTVLFSMMALAPPADTWGV
jgi:ubiquitin carboxyl-terminal hydrolase L3